MVSKMILFLKLILLGAMVFKQVDANEVNLNINTMKAISDEFLDPNEEKHSNFLSDFKEQCEKGQTSPETILRNMKYRLMDTCNSHILRESAEKLSKEKTIIEELREVTSISAQPCILFGLLVQSKLDITTIEEFSVKVNKELGDLTYVADVCSSVAHNESSRMKEQYTEEIRNKVNKISSYVANYIDESRLLLWPTVHNRVLREMIQKFVELPEKFKDEAFRDAHTTLKTIGDKNYVYGILVVKPETEEYKFFYEGIDNYCSAKYGEDNRTHGFDTVIARLPFNQSLPEEKFTVLKRMHMLKEHVNRFEAIIRLELEQLCQNPSLPQIAATLKNKFGPDFISKEMFHGWAIVRESSFLCPTVEYRSSPYTDGDLDSIISIECLRTGSNSASPDARLIRAATQKLLLNGILFYEGLLARYEEQFHVELNETLTWKTGFPTEEELSEEIIDLPIGMGKYDTSQQKTAIKSMSRHLISLGDLHRYKSLIDGSENYETSKSYYQKSSQLWPSTGHPYNQLGVVVYYSKRVIDEFFYLTRALACAHPYEAARDRLKQRLDAMRTKVSKYQPVLDKECGIVKEQGNALRRLQIIRQIWIHPITESTQDGTGEKVKDDILSHFLEHSKAKLHRRAVSYLSDTFGLLVTKIGMEHFESVSERAFGLLYASLAKTETDFSADQLVKLAAMFIYVVQTNLEKATTSSSTSQLETSVNTVVTYFLVLLEHLETHRTLLFPALNVLATWICHPETEGVWSTVGHVESIGKTILPKLTGLIKDYGSEEGPKGVYPETVLLASFFKVFEPSPVETGRSRMDNLKDAMEKIKSLKKTSQKKEEGEEEKTPEEEDNEEPKSRERIIEEERDKEKATIVIHPEYLIPDTNVFIGELELIRQLLEVASKVDKLQILVPTIVLDELQNISKLSASDPKSNSESHDPDRISKAKQAVGWLKEQAKGGGKKTNSLFTLTTQGKRLHSLIMAAEDLDGIGKMTNDDMILQSAVKWSESLPAPASSSILSQIGTPIRNATLRNCVLITGDRGLTIKAIGASLPCRGIANFAKWMT
uniref:PINc domain-containing protein n=3 Tax=Caenorhabditis tropicalis TaxID=1561998 RepID=A0A1I7THG2_9PELO